MVDIVVWVVVSLDLAKSFGRGVGLAIELIFRPFVFALVLGFGSDAYRGPAATPPPPHDRGVRPRWSGPFRTLTPCAR